MTLARWTTEEKKRAGEAIVQYERTNIGGTTNAQRTKGGLAISWWAKITGSDGSGYYSWEALKPDDDGSLIEDDNYPTGDHSADEGWAVEATGSKWVITGDIVHIIPVAIKPYFIFEYHPGVKMAKFTGTIDAGSDAAPGKGSATVRTFDGTSYTDGSAIDVFNPWSTELDSTNTPGSRIQLSFGESVWWVSGANCEDDST